MRVIILAGSLVLLAGCATKEETVAFNMTMYQRCAANAARSGAEPVLKCGRDPAKYESKFSEKYHYFQDQYRDQQQQQRQQQAAYDAAHPEVVKYRQCYEATLAQPTRTGTLGEAMSTAQLVCSGTVPYSATRPTPIQTTNCLPNGIGGFTCTTQ